MKRIVLLLLCASANISVHAQNDLNTPIPLDPKVKMGVLPNGIHYYVRQNSKPERRAEFRLAVNAGSNFEDDDQQGIAHLTEHLAFNGTKNFKKNDLIDYLESVGTKFGPHLNAYTSFDETVYMIQIPTDKSDIVDKGLQILEDWSHNLLFDSVEVDKERGVVIEEWRIGQGAGERMRRQYWPLLFKDSRYALRLPIGKKEIVEKTPQQTIRKFYNDWYRPDLMAVIAVGDFDPVEMEKKIIAQFSNVPQKQGVKTWKAYDVPEQKELIYSAVTDKENTSTSVELLYKLPREISITVKNYRDDMVDQLFSSMMNARFNEMSRKANAPFLNAGGGIGAMVRTENSFDASARCSEEKSGVALNALITELERIRRFGFTETELQRMKAEMMDQMKTQYNEREKSPSAGYAREYVSNFLSKESMPGIEKEYEYYTQYLNGISVDEVNAVGKKVITGSENCFVLITYPQKADVKVPIQSEVVAMFKAVQTAELSAYVDVVSDKPIISRKVVAESVLTEVKNEKYGTTKWTFKNGITVIAKPTDFNNDQIIFGSYEPGGWSSIDRSVMYSALAADEIIDASGIGEMDATMLDKKLAGKTVGCSPNISMLYQGLSGSCAPKDLSSLMELIYGYYSEPRVDSDAVAAIREKKKTALINKNSNPQSVFNDTVNYLMSGYHYSAKPMTVDKIDSIDSRKSLEIYKKLFSDVSGTKFYFIGNFNLDTLKYYASLYISNILSSGLSREWKDLQIKSPSGKISKVVKKGIAPKSYVSLRWNMPFVFNLQNRNEAYALNKLINIRLREVLREDKSGVYGVNFSTIPTHYPKPKLENIVGFNCKPENVDSLIAAVWQVVNEVKSIGCDDKNLEKIKQTFLRERETALKENTFWLSLLMSYDKNLESIEQIDGYNAWVNSLQGKDFVGFAKNYLNTDNYAKLVLMPEK